MFLLSRRSDQGSFKLESGGTQGLLLSPLGDCSVVLGSCWAPGTLGLVSEGVSGEMIFLPHATIVFLCSPLTSSVGSLHRIHHLVPLPTLPSHGNTSQATSSVPQQSSPPFCLWAFVPASSLLEPEVPSAPSANPIYFSRV